VLCRRETPEAIRLYGVNLTDRRTGSESKQFTFCRDVAKSGFAEGDIMKKTDRLVNILASDIEHKDVLEVACGAADFSISAARIANMVSCIDLDDSRLNNQVKQNNVRFQIMDASNMSYSDNEFDTIVIYNAFFSYPVAMEYD